MINKERTLYALSQHYDLSLMYELEPNRTEFLVDLAFECVAMGEPTRSALPGLAMYATRLVGSNAVCPVLRTAKYEIALHTFLEWLLSSLEMDAMEQEKAS